jgi:lipoic acid synthetase
MLAAGGGAKLKPNTRKPPWLTRRLPSGPEYEKIRRLMNRGRLHTVCQEAKCPNIWECFSNRTATFLILGDRCTRNCRFCAVAHSPVAPPDPAEPVRVAETVEKLGLAYVVITSVTRDDLPDGGAGHFAKTIREIHRRIPEAVIEVLIPDFKGDAEALRAVLEARPQVLNHNIETVPRLYATVRPGAVYARSLELLERVKTIDASIPTKSGLMLGLGETTAEIRQTLQDLLDVGCRMLTLGQYLQPSKDHLPVARFVPPAEFDQWQQTAFQMGFSEVASGPFVRSSYHAKELFNAAKE